MSLHSLHLAYCLSHNILIVVVVANIASGQEIELTISNHKTARRSILAYGASIVYIDNLILELIPHISIYADILDIEVWIGAWLVAQWELI